MRIKETKSNLTSFGKLKHGVAFRYRDTYYLKVFDASNRKVYVVSLTTGNLTTFCPEYDVVEFPNAVVLANGLEPSPDVLCT